MEEHAPGAIWPATDFDDVQIREVYSRYGLAMFMVQVLEHGMVNAAIIMRSLPTMRSHQNVQGWHTTFDRAYEAGLSRTYGNMLKQLDTIEEFPPLLLERLRSAKEDRDVLAHRFFRQNDIAFLNREGRTAMIAWCEERIELFQSLSNEIDAFTAPICERYGISQSAIDEKIRQSLEDAKNWTADPPQRP